MTNDDSPEEIWKRIDGLDKYEVSSFGRVKNSVSGRILNGSVNNHGYIRYDLCMDGKRIVRSGHRLVANAFIHKVYGMDIVNHKDGNKTNNNVSNLEWSNYHRNAIHSVYDLNNYPKSNWKKVICVETQVVYDTTKYAERDTGVSHTGIISCCKGKRKTAGGFHWEYADIT